MPLDSINLQDKGKLCEKNTNSSIQSQNLVQNTKRKIRFALNWLHTCKKLSFEKIGVKIGYEKTSVQRFNRNIFPANENKIFDLHLKLEKIVNELKNGVKNGTKL